MILIFFCEFSPVLCSYMSPAEFSPMSTRVPMHALQLIYIKQDWENTKIVMSFLLCTLQMAESQSIKITNDLNIYCKLLEVPGS